MPADRLNSPRFTVVIPTCRRDESLARCLDLLVPGAQTLPAAEYEVIVTDDGPPDGNARLMVEARYPSVRWVQGPRLGPAANRNFGASHARGTWLVFTDDDCLPQPGWLSAFANRLDAGTDHCRVLEGRTDAGVAKIGPFEQAPANTLGGLLWSCNIAVERSLFDEMGGFDAGFPYPHLEDVDFRLRLDDAGERYLFVREACIIHPPRPVVGALKWARSQESAFYLARKRGSTVAAGGFGFGGYARLCLHAFRAASGVGECVRLAWRILREVALLCVYLPRFAKKYGHPGRGGAPAARLGRRPLK